MIRRVKYKIKQFISKDFKTIVIFLLFIFLTLCPLPYYIEAPGGTIDISSRIEVEDGYSSKGSFHLAYVQEMKATLPTWILAHLKKDWDLIPKYAAIPDNEEEKDVDFRDHLLLDSANQTAITLAFQKAGKEIHFKNRKLYITYIDSAADTTLHVGDEVLEVNGVPVFDDDMAKDILQEFEIGDVIPFTIVRNQEQLLVYAKMMQYDESYKAVGILLTETVDIETNPQITFHFKSTESGSSGGLMMSLAIYNALTPNDLTNGKKIVGTGTIDIDGNVGTIAGIQYKLKGAIREHADIFLVPNGDNYEEAIKLKEKYHYDIEIVNISTFDEALSYLQNMQK